MMTPKDGPSETVNSAYAKIAPRYEKVMGSSYQYLPRQIDAFFASFAAGSAILDAGCGPGIEAAAR